jgi:CubicO group peptidase (beta-lactamase class C family)
MEAFVRQRMGETGVPGVAYAVVGPKGVEEARTLGTDGAGAPITRSTPFLWGSVSKPVAATLTIALAETGAVQLDSRVVDYLPAFRMRSRTSSDHITIRQLLDHTSGIPTSMELTDRFHRDRRPADVLPELADVSAVSEPGAAFHYSSVNYLVLTAVIEAVTAQPYSEVLSDRVLQPAGMRDAITRPVEAEGRLPPGHRYVFGQALGFDSPYDPAGVGYGYLGGSLDDLAAFTSATLGGEHALLSPDQREGMWGASTSSSSSTERGYELGWRRWSIEGTEAPMVWHGGAAAGYFAMLIILPELERGVVVLQNAYGTLQEPQLLDTAFGLAAMLRGQEPAVHSPGAAYAATLTGLVTLLVLLGALVWHSGRALRRSPGGMSRRRAGWMALLWLGPLLGLAYGLGIALPSTYALRITQFVLWAPDLAWLVYVALGLTVLLAGLRALYGWRTLASSPRSH